MTRRGVTWAATVALTAVVLMLATTAIWSAATVRSSSHRVEVATTSLSAYQALQRAVAGEAFAEAGYRRWPRDGARARIDAAVAQVTTEIDGARTAAGPADAVLLSHLHTVNDRYVREVRDHIDDPAAARSQDRVAGPALDAIQALIDGAVTGHAKSLAVAVGEQQRLAHRLNIAIPAVFAAGILALAACWTVLLIRQNRITAQAREHEARSLQDPLTGLGNRTLFYRRLDADLDTHAPRLAVMLLDIDDFKAVNDTHGHAVGDQVLIHVGQVLREALGEQAVIARLGGDEFAAFAPVEADEMARRAHRVLDRLARPTGPRLPAHPAASIGIAAATSAALSRSEVLHQADLALYQAKALGKNTVVGVQVAPPDPARTGPHMPAPRDRRHRKPLAQPLSKPTILLE